MKDLIDRQAAIDFIDAGHLCNPNEPRWSDNEVVNFLKSRPSAQPEIKVIGYRDCANAMMKMWMDNVVTDGEYNRIMDKLNTYWRSRNGK